MNRVKKQRYIELKINKKRKQKELKESKNYYSIPKINSFSKDLVIIKGNYNMFNIPTIRWILYIS